MKVADVVRKYFPGVSDETAMSVAWGCTGYPSFWNIPHDGKTPLACFRKQLREISKRSDADPSKALAIASDDLDVAMADMYRRDVESQCGLPVPSAILARA